MVTVVVSAEGGKFKIGGSALDSWCRYGQEWFGKRVLKSGSTPELITVSQEKEVHLWIAVFLQFYCGGVSAEEK